MEGSDLRAALSCSICQEVYKDPATLLCGHNFCYGCITQAFDSQREEYKCPDCQKTFLRRPAFTRNPTLKSIAEACSYSQQEGEAPGIFCAFCDLSVTAVKSCLQCGLSMCHTHVRRHNRMVKHTLLPATVSPEERKCPTHNKILDYFCRTDWSCICASCFIAGDHANHSVEPLEEAFERKKEKLRNIQEELTLRRMDTEGRLQTSRAEMQKKALQREQTVMAFLRDIRENLEDLEKKVLEELHKKEEKRSLPVAKRVRQLESKILQLSRKTSYIQELQDMDDPVYVLKEQESSREDFCDIEDREELEGEEENKDHHGLGDLGVGPISDKLKMLSDIIVGVEESIDLSLNVNTAGQNVYVEEDRKTATWSLKPQNYPDTPERFHCNQVLSCESVTSGKCYWDLETSDTGDWRIGVCYPSIDKREHPSTVGNNEKSWCLYRCNNPISLPSEGNKYPHYLVIHGDAYTPLPHTVSCNRLRVSLDYEGGRLSFFELGDHMRHLHTFRATFLEPLHAVIYVWDKINGNGSWVRMTGCESQ